MARRHVKQRYGFVAKTFAMHDNGFAVNGATNYENPRVREIKEMLGAFQYPPDTISGAKRERRPLKTLENGA